MRKDFLFAMVWTMFLLWPSSQGESRVLTITEKPPSIPPLEKRVDQLYKEIEEATAIAVRQQDSLNLLK